MVNCISILGSTGSIGRQSLDVVRKYPQIRVGALTAGTSIRRLAEQCWEFRPELAVVATEAGAAQLRQAISDLPTRVLWGEEGLIAAATLESVDCVITAVVGMLGLKPTLAAIRAKKRIGLANKETLVCAGELVMAEAKRCGAEIVPVDSEHSAIFQCLMGCADRKEVRRLLLTCSGGPFFGMDREALAHVTKADALKHPNWKMGPKITVDCATLMNKGLEVIEAMRLYDLPLEKVDVLIHRQSIVHSLVEFNDGAIMAQLGTPDMRLPILYAMSYPERLPTGGAPLDLFSLSGLTFERPDPERFPSLRLARECLRAGGAACCELNAANEAAVAHLLQQPLQPAGGKCMTIGRIYEVVEETLNRLGVLPAGSLDEILEADRRARDVAASLLAAD